MTFFGQKAIDSPSTTLNENIMRILHGSFLGVSPQSCCVTIKPRAPCFALFTASKVTLLNLLIKIQTISTAFWQSVCLLHCHFTSLFFSNWRFLYFIYFRFRFRKKRFRITDYMYKENNQLYYASRVVFLHAQQYKKENWRKLDGTDIALQLKSL